MRINSFANAIIQENDVELFTFLGDGGDLPPFSRSYNEIASMTREIQENIARLSVLGDEIELSIQNINSSLSQDGDQPVFLERSDLQSPRRLRRVPSMENLAAIDCERMAEELASSFPDDPSIAPGWLFDPNGIPCTNQASLSTNSETTLNPDRRDFGNGSERPFQSCSYQIR